MGCSNPHPHGQVWSLSAVPTLPASELRNMHIWADRRRSQSQSVTSEHPGHKADCLLCNYAAQELRAHASAVERGAEHNESRIVVENEHFVALVPWWATWPFEAMGAFSLSLVLYCVLMMDTVVLPHKKHHHSLLSLSSEERDALADVLNRLTKRYDNLFKCVHLRLPSHSFSGTKYVSISIDVPLRTPWVSINVLRPPPLNSELPPASRR